MLPNVTGTRCPGPPGHYEHQEADDETDDAPSLRTKPHPGAAPGGGPCRLRRVWRPHPRPQDIRVRPISGDVSSLLSSGPSPSEPYLPTRRSSSHSDRGGIMHDRSIASGSDRPVESLETHDRDAPAVVVRSANSRDGGRRWRCVRNAALGLSLPMRLVRSVAVRSSSPAHRGPLHRCRTLRSRMLPARQDPVSRRARRAQ